MNYQVIHGNNIDVLKTFPDNHFDSIVTDPPYGIDFLGKEWDANTGALETYQQCLRVLKPGGHILAFSAARTYHHLAITLEKAGFEIRDQIMWIYSSGFPKSQDIGKSIQRSLGVKEYEEVAVDTTKNTGFGMTDHARVRAGEEWSTPATTVKKVIATDPEAKQWEGWGTALKPGHEPIALARKPTKVSIAKNVQKWGTGAINIDATRIPTADTMTGGAGGKNTYKNFSAENISKIYSDNIPRWESSDGGRFPSNVIGEIAEPYQKYFYCPKVSRKERHVGHEAPPANGTTRMYGEDQAVTRDTTNLSSGNNHPTVKPIELMKYLIKLVTPKNGRVLDPFNGSGSTGMAAVELGHEYVGIDLDPKYVEISKKRIEAWNKPQNNIDDLIE